MNKEIEEVASHIVDSAIKVHTALGPGLLESAYQRCLVRAYPSLSPEDLQAALKYLNSRAKILTTSVF